jgi:hypothetical protein
MARRRSPFDYFATGNLVLEIAAQIVTGVARLSRARHDAG